MKNIIVIYTLAMASAVCFMACEKKEKGGLGEGRVQGVDLRAPINGSTVTLAENGDGLQFKWSEATVSNGTLAFYTVVFDKASGDFSQPIMSRRPDKLGSTTVRTVPRMTSDPMERAVGDTGGNPVDIRSPVHASTGINGADATQPFTLKLEVTQDQQGDILITAADQMME